MKSLEIILIIFLFVACLYLFVLSFRELYRLRCKKQIIKLLPSIVSKEETIREPKIRQMKPKSEKDCPYCQKEQVDSPAICTHAVIPWSEMKKGKGGRTKKNQTEGHACLKPDCIHYGITDQTIHALVANGSHRVEKIGDLTCLACQAEFSRRRNTVLHRLKTPSETAEKIRNLEAHGVDTAVLETVFGVKGSTIMTWRTRSGEHGRKLHERFFQNLGLEHVQLDELWGKVKRSSRETWVWVATEARTKIIAVIQVGERSQEMAYSFLHELKRRMILG